MNQIKSGALALLFVLLMSLSMTVVAADRMELEGAAIQGTKELPKVLYIVPWKKADAAILGGASEAESLKGELSSLDRDVFLREIKYQSVLGDSEVAASTK